MAWMTSGVPWLVLLCTVAAVCPSAHAVVDGPVVAWGYNGDGQCNVPTPNTGFVAIAGGGSHSLGLKADGSIAAWGRNEEGQCNVPAPNTDFIAAAGRGYHSLGLRSTGSIVAWGDNSFGQCDVPTPNTGFIAISAGERHSLGLKADGSIIAWGSNTYGQCDVPEPNSAFIAVTGGALHSLGLKSDGSIVAWGYNNLGQIDVPVPNEGFIAVAAASSHSLGLKADGSIVAWGSNESGQGDVPVPNSGFVAIAGGADHSMGLRSDGLIAVWGYNEFGQCEIPAPNSGFIAVAAGENHSYGLRADGACCHGSCQVLPAFECGVQGGSYQGDESDCDPGPCAQFHALMLTPNATCHTTEGGTVTVNILFIQGGSDEILGGQFFLQYDPTKLDFVGADVGDSPFTNQVYEGVNETGGTIDYAVGVPLAADPGYSGAGPLTMATITFQAIGQACGVAELVTFRDTSQPYETRLTRRVGTSGSEPFVPESLNDLEAITLDWTAPTITCPAAINQTADIGVCYATITALGTPTTGDNCGVASVTNDKPTNDQYPVGTTTVTWTVTDTCGHTVTCIQTVTVEAVNELVVSVELDNATFTGTRCFTFELWNCAGGSWEYPVVVDFVDGLGTTASPILVDCGEYTCITARDELHTLRQTIDAWMPTGTQYMADFTDADDLRGGDLNGDNWIDILDYGVFSWKFGKKYRDGVEVSAPPLNGNTTCSTGTHADIDGDGLVATSDFTFISTQFLYGSEPNCCGAADPGDGPITRISLADLAASGLGELAAGDVNRDGWLDQIDMEEFAAGLASDQPGDLNCDGLVGFGDINPFVLYLSNLASWQATFAGCDPRNGDINGDGLYPNFGDINPFVLLLSGGG